MPACGQKRPPGGRPEVTSRGRRDSVPAVNSVVPAPVAVDPAPRAAASWLVGLVLLLSGAAWASVSVAAAGLAWPFSLLPRLLDSVAWLAGALLLIRLIELLLWERLIPRVAGVRMPRLLRQFVAVLLLILALAALLNQAWGVAIATVLATTGVLGLVLGLALRPILTDLFSGIALNIEQPFRLNDFVVLRMRGQREPIVGTVREINWRSTRVLTPEDNLISVPNSVAAAAIVENLSYPSPVSEQEVDIVLDWLTPSAVIEQVLNAAVTEAWAQGATAGDKPPKVRICKLDGAGVTYKIVYLLDPRRKPKGPAKHALLSSVQKHLRAAGLQPVALQDAAVAAPATAPARADHARVEHRQALLAGLPLLAVLQPAEHAALAQGAVLHRAEAGQAVVAEGDTGASMYVVAAGVLEVRQGEARLAVLGPGAVFGEMSLLTGAPRSATVAAVTAATLYEVTADSIAPLLTARPALAEALSTVMAQHQHDDRLRLQGAAPAPDQPALAAGLAEQIAERIRRFFGR